MAAWEDHAIWWQIYPLGFCGAPIRTSHSSAPRFNRLIDWLDYAVELGTSGLLLGPIFASETHGYDTVDHFQIDSRLGTDTEFATLVEQAKARGLRLLLDGVFSHVGRSHPLFQQALAAGPSSTHGTWFDIDWEGSTGPQARTFEGHGALVRFNHAEPAVAEYVTQIMRHWLDRGIDGWRLDAAYSVPAEFWAATLPKVRETHPEAWLLGEVIHGDYPQFVTEAKVDSVTQYQLWKAIWSSLKDRNFFELDWALTTHNKFISEFKPNTFVGNHDVTRIASTLGARGAVIAASILLTVGGIPSIYAGDEQGFTGIKREDFGGDDDIRPAFPATPSELSALGQPILRAHQDLIGLRRRHPWLVDAETTRQSLTNTSLRYRATANDGSAELFVDIDLDRDPCVTISDNSGQLWSFS